MPMRRITTGSHLEPIHFYPLTLTRKSVRAVFTEVVILKISISVSIDFDDLTIIGTIHISS